VIPPALASAPREPSYVGPAVLGGTAAAAADDGSTGHPTLDKYLDVRVRRRAQLAPLAVFVLVALALIVYFSVK
jgi:hypothetical protein